MYDRDDGIDFMDGIFVDVAFLAVVVAVKKDFRKRVSDRYIWIGCWMG